MSSGTLVKIERYHNRYHLHSLEQLREEREDSKKKLEEVWGQILALAMATPKDICHADDEPEHYISERIEALRELVEIYEGEIEAYNDIEEGWETREED